ncbi:gamma-glutamylcyclotransferase family protein [Natronolimnobius baerhuensis]|uniref:Gamma-glutamylcyclotransferase n=1 Tax=Natronolimnobius baerhuensis TaxID=253108 RepID=A0A202E6V3_9EURY|nr:gamma-glutamylcyclotransferase family protein [Natronolimnobius baerhuensis]OVE83977.1 gamma-glutamylcyclotransferase [Natronolimnobius baerhuensis]
MYVFVYGTLTEPNRVQDVLAVDTSDSSQRDPSLFDGPAVLEGLHRVEGRYPTLAPGGHVEGRLLCVDDQELERLDRYEGVDTGLYTRVSVPGDGLEGPVAVYVGDPDRLGVSTECEWPSGASFVDRVQTVCDRGEIYVRRTE